MTAEKMFLLLGFKKDNLNRKDIIRYVNEEKRYFIIFNIDEEVYTIGCKNWLVDVYIDIKLQNAINKQVEELGWPKGSEKE